MFDSRIVIFIKFWTKIELVFWGASENCPPPPLYVVVPSFGMIWASAFRTDSHSAWPHGGVLKKSSQISGSASDLMNPDEKGPLTLRTTESQRYCWKTSRVEKRSFLVVVRLGVRGTERGSSFLFRIPRPDAELEIYVGFFQKFSVWPSTAATFTGRWRPNRPKIGNGCVKKKGRQFHLPPKIPTLFGYRTWWIFYVCYQTWSNSMIWPSYGRSKLTVQKWRLHTAFEASTRFQATLNAQNLVRSWTYIMFDSRIRISINF